MQNHKESGAQRMGLKTFKGGVHPFEGKELAMDSPITEVLPKGEMVYPMSQHIGAPASPIVAVGDKVLKGQKIAEAGGFVSSPIYSSVSGTVKAIEKRRVAVGDMVNSIVIENDGEFNEVSYNAVEDVTSLSKEDIISIITEQEISTLFLKTLSALKVVQAPMHSIPMPVPRVCCASSANRLRLVK